jgi:hypothetical protein
MNYGAISSNLKKPSFSGSKSSINTPVIDYFVIEVYLVD